LKDKTISVDWKVENETGIVKYELEKSTDGYSFTKATTINVSSNNGSSNYSWIDKEISNNNFYRIKSISTSGEIKYSQIVKVVTGNKQSEITAFPNPLQNNTINLQFINEVAGNYKVNLINAIGQVVYSNSIITNSNNTSQALTVPQQLSKGVYQLQVNGNDKNVMTQQVIVQ